jgi:hypothetical protein
VLFAGRNNPNSELNLARETPHPLARLSDPKGLMQEVFIKYSTAADQLRLGLPDIRKSCFCEVFSHCCPSNIKSHLCLIHPTRQGCMSLVRKVPFWRTAQRLRDKETTFCEPGSQPGDRMVPAHLAVRTFQYVLTFLQDRKNESPSVADQVHFSKDGTMAAEAKGPAELAWATYTARCQ